MAEQKSSITSDAAPTHSPSRWLNSTVIGIALASLCSDVGHEMATTAMPLLLASVGASAAALGLIEGLADGAASFAKLFSGLYVDRLRRRKPLAVIGYFVTASGMASFALATRWWHVLLGRVGGWMGRGARTPVRKVLLAEATTPETYGRAFGFERAMDSVGATIGPLLTLLLVGIAGLRGTFALTLIPGLLAALLIALLVGEQAHQPLPHAKLLSSVSSLPREFRRYLVGVGLAGLGDYSNTLLILWATEGMAGRLGMAAAARLAMAFYVGFNVIYSMSCYVSGILADRFAKDRVLAAGYSLAAIPAIVLMWPGVSPAKFAAAFAFSGVYMGVWETVESATAATMLPKPIRGVGFGVLDTVNGIGDFFSSAAVGLLWAVAPRWAMLFVIAASLSGAAVIAGTRPAVKEKNAAKSRRED
jgi:MFS family permease